MCVCVSTIAGMTVLPVRSTRAAPAGTFTCPRLPTCVKRLFATMKAEFSMGAAPSPTMSRAPSNTVTAVPCGACVAPDVEKAARKRRPKISLRMEPSRTSHCSPNPHAALLAHELLDIVWTAGAPPGGTTRLPPAKGIDVRPGAGRGAGAPVGVGDPGLDPIEELRDLAFVLRKN